MYKRAVPKPEDNTRWYSKQTTTLGSRAPDVWPLIRGSPEASWPLTLSFLDLPISQKLQLKLSSKVGQSEKCRMPSYTWTSDKQLITSKGRHVSCVMLSPGIRLGTKAWAHTPGTEVASALSPGLPWVHVACQLESGWSLASWGLQWVWECLKCIL